MMTVYAPERKRPVKTLPKKRAFSVAYYLSKKIDKKSKRVCQSFFISALGISKNRLNTVAKVIDAGNGPKEKRGGDKISHKSEEKKIKIRDFVGKLKGRESHYNRHKSKRIYLSADLSIAKLCRQFNEQHPDDKTSLSMFTRVFVNDFNVGFSSPASDVCGMCTRLKRMKKIEKDPNKKQDLQMELRVHQKRANTFYELMREKFEKSLTLCFDLQQVHPLPRTPISDAFYAHQINFYVFCCVDPASKFPYFYTWSEDQAGRGSVEIGSALLSHLNSLSFDGTETLRLFCDGCGGQNKNTHIVHALYYWLRFKSPPQLENVIITYPVRGHSFLPADRVFGRVEKLLRKTSTIISKEEYERLYSQVGTVKALGRDWKIFDIKGLQNCLAKVKGISDYKQILLTKGTNGNTVKAKYYENFRFETGRETWNKLLKRGKTDKDLVLKEVNLGRDVPDKKKASIRHLMAQQFGQNWEQDEDLCWYKDILSHNAGDRHVSVIEEQDEDDEEACICLEEEVAVHV